jgi:hypothetical protein
MTDKYSSPRVTALQELEAALDDHRRALARAWDGGSAEPPQAPRRWRFWLLRRPTRLWFPLDRNHPLARRLILVAVGLGAFLLAGGGALWWRLSSGPIMLDLATPWLTAAIEQNLGSRYRVEVGGTQLERDPQGYTALRLRDIVLRDASGSAVAIAPKAEVGISGTSLLFARPRAKSIRLVDANMTIRIDADGRVNVMVGGERPLFTTVLAPDTLPPPAAAPSAPSQAPRTAASQGSTAAGPFGNFSFQAMVERGVASNVAALLAWLDSMRMLEFKGTDDTGGFDGHGLSEIGIINGSLTIDDKRDGRDWTLSQISLRLSRQTNGGAMFQVLSDNEERPWSVKAALTPLTKGHRRFVFEARQVVLDDLLALRMAKGRLRSDTQVSASIDSELAADGTPQQITGSIVARGGSIGAADDPDHRLTIGGAEFGLDWDVARRTLRVPFKVTAGGARYALRAEFAAPAQPGGNWLFAMGGGWIVLECAATSIRNGSGSPSTRVTSAPRSSAVPTRRT